MEKNNKKIKNKTSLEESVLEDILLDSNLTPDLIVVKSVFFFMSRLTGFAIAQKIGVAQLISSSTRVSKMSRKISEITGENFNVFLLRDGLVVPKGEPNAFATGGTNVFFTVGLSKMVNENELIAILLHEVGHNKEYHNEKGALFTTTSSVAIFTTLHVAALITGNALFFPLAVIASSFLRILFIDITIGNAISRKNEFVADSYAAKYGFAREMISALKKFEIYEKKKLCVNLNAKECNARLEELHSISTHPSFKKRIQKLTQLLSKRFSNFISSGSFSESMLKLKLYKNTFLARLESIEYQKNGN